MIDVKLVTALVVATLLAGCGEQVTLGGGPAPDTLEGQMLAPDPWEAGEIDDATGIQIP